MQDQSAAAAPSAPTPPALQGTAVSTATQAPVAQVGGPYTSAEMYQAIRVQRRLIQDQLSTERSQRNRLAEEIRDPMVTGADRTGLEARIIQHDSRIKDLEESLARVQQQEAQAAGVPGATQPTAADLASQEVEAALTIGLVLTFVIVLPLSIAFARRLWKRHAVTLTLPPELTTRLESIEQGVEATAIEVERIGEGQRFVTQLLAARQVGEQHSLPANAPPSR